MESLQVRKVPHAVVVTFNRPQYGNSINRTLLDDIHAVLDQYENDTDCKAIILESSSNVFCAGMDFKSVFSQNSIPMEWINRYKDTLKRFTETSKLMIAKVEGKVMAGGIGLVAACDLVFASDKASFCLPESLWGLLPANVLPYLIRRIGFQNAYYMTLTTKTVNATDAKYMHLIDVLCHEPDVEINACLEKITLVAQDTVGEMKSYFKKLWIMDQKTENMAVETLANLIKTPLFQTNKKNFLEKNKFPWDK